MRNFRALLEAKWAKGTFVCVGLDSEFGKIPELAKPKWWSWRRYYRNRFHTIVAFNRSIIEATKDLVCAYKPNTAFYEAYGDEGIVALHRTIMDIHAIAPDVPVILDAKRADIGNTNIGYVQEAFEYFRADAVTVHPYLGAEALQPFLDRKDKGIFVLCRTSNPGAGEFQDVGLDLTDEIVEKVERSGGRVPFEQEIGNSLSLFHYVAYNVATKWNKNGNCALVVGATYPDELREVRGLVGDMPILIPGIGAQGGEIEKTVKAGKDSRGKGMIINSSRGIIFASSGSDFAEAARRETIKLRDAINQYL